jgi:adenosylhomocysteine nucleosidase
MPMEHKPLKRQLSLKKTAIGSLKVYAGALGDRPVVAIVTGIGSVLAADGVERLLDAMDIEHVVVVGITGAIDDESPIGTLVLPTVVVNGATGAEYQPKQIGGKSPRGKLFTSDELITSPDDVARLRVDGVIALDMETAVVAEICQRRNIPWSVFRAFSDRASEVSLDDDVFRLLNRDGTFNVKMICAFFVRHPGRLPALARLAKDAKLAAEHASAAAVDAVSQLPRDAPFPRDT